MLLAIVVVFAACKKDDDYKVDYTVTLNNGDTVEVYENEDGENFVTNVDGDEIPVTTDKDGYYDDIEVLITETTTKKSDKTTEADKNDEIVIKPSESKTEPSSKNDDDSTSTTQSDVPTSENKDDPTESTTESTTERETVYHPDGVEWSDIIPVP